MAITLAASNTLHVEKLTMAIEEINKVFLLTVKKIK